MKKLSIVCFIALELALDAQQRSFSVVEASIADMQTAMRAGRATSRGIVQQYLERIAKYEERLNAIMTLNPRALEEADARDRERAQGKMRGPLHGIPIALKDNIHTTDMPTTGGALAFRGFVPPYEATLTAHLREAGAIIIAKTTMTELANWIATGMPGNYSALGGYGLNPYDPRVDPRPETSDGRPALNAGGSSSGIGTAANFWAANVGTETSGSILTPANQTMLAGIKPTVGRISRHGIIPITADQDTAGPMARTVADAAILLGVLEGRAPDPRDAATKACPRIPNSDYTRFLNARGLAGARIGVARVGFVDEDRHGQALRDAIAILRQHGATVVDPADLPDQPPPVCRDDTGIRGKDVNCSIVFKYGMKRDFNAWLASLGSTAPVKTLTELRQWNLAHRAEGALKYGQAQLDNSDDVDLERDRARYRADRAADVRITGAEGIDLVMKRARLDALLFPGSTGAAVAAKPGYPTVIVPFTFVPNAPTPPFPAGFDARPAPLGMSFTGGACSEPRLIEIAYAFEQATKRRVAPTEFP
ncbi:MAG TPA: amidase family protein [Vicinamibacterales bacterium]|nr:amidase family protein [Vicinamibacterales bacterium]